jgi:hypothetical protein
MSRTHPNRPTRAYCYPSGLIVFARRNPGYARIIARGPDRARMGHSRRSLGGRRNGVPGAYDLLVPGVPEAESEIAAHAALDRWTRWIAASAPKGVRVLINSGAGS